MDPRNVVDGVPLQGKQVDDALGRHAELRAYTLGIETLILNGVNDRDALAHQLEQVLVRGRDENLVTGIHPAACECSDDVISLDAVDLDDGKPEHVAEFAGIG